MKKKPETEKLVREKIEQIKKLKIEIMRLTCPYKVGDLIERNEHGCLERYKITEIRSDIYGDGYKLIGMKISKYGWETLIHREICDPDDSTRKVGSKKSLSCIDACTIRRFNCPPCACRIS